ncbi:MAG: rRNA pseudouridine synthase [Chloroflexi bacterium]|nr:rRNA pseudouridine synthase [Chloroflexota bacterium]
MVPQPRGVPRQAGSSLSRFQRLQKVLADRGVASRRHAEVLISAGRVRVDGEVVRELGTKVDPAARIEVDGRTVAAAQRPRYVALHKPAGIVSSARAERGRPSVTDLVGARERLYPVGRLDVDSEGLVLLTNDGGWAERVLHPRYGHEREYEVDVIGPVTDDTVGRLRRGVRLEEGLARAEQATVLTRDTQGGRLRLVLRTGWKRQVRRMCVAVGLRVRRLVRVRIGPLRLGRLAPGTWRELTAREVLALQRSSDERVPREERVRKSGAAIREPRRAPRTGAPAPGHLADGY